MPFASFFTNNPLFAWGLVVLAALGIIRTKEELDEARGRRQAERAAEKRARKVQVKISEKNDEKLEKAERTRASFRASPVSARRRMSDRARAVLTRRSERGGDGEGQNGL
jgi:biopolymer transport protein ExbB/TolQ